MLLSFRFSILLSSFILQAYLVKSFQFNFNFPTIKTIIASSGVALTIFSISPPLPANAVNAAIDGAISSMLQKSERLKPDNREFDSLTDAAKRRRSLILCKQESARKSVGYNSLLECNNQVFNGNFEISTKLKLVIPTEINSISNIKSESKVVKQDAKKQKDLFDLTPAQKKRRAIAACKNPEIRKFANTGSESKCTAAAIAGNYDSIIEALEYGL